MLDAKTPGLCVSSLLRNVGQIVASEVVLITWWWFLLDIYLNSAAVLNPRRWKLKQKVISGFQWKSHAADILSTLSHIANLFWVASSFCAKKNFNHHQPSKRQMLIYLTCSTTFIHCRKEEILILSNDISIVFVLQILSKIHHIIYCQRVMILRKRPLKVHYATFWWNRDRAVDIRNSSLLHDMTFRCNLKVHQVTFYSNCCQPKTITHMHIFSIVCKCKQHLASK